MTTPANPSSQPSPARRAEGGLGLHAGAGWGLLVPRPSGVADLGVALALAALYGLVLLATVDGLGYARDEGFYFVAARAYRGWFQLLFADPEAALAAVDRAWRVNHEHPALIKSLFALSSAAQQHWGVFELEGTSYRFPAMGLAGLAVGLTYLWGTRAAGRFVGLVAAGSLAFMPRFFFHAHLACFDAPIVAMWLLAAYAYWRAIGRGGVARYLAAGVAFGLALNTKHNSWFLPPVFVLHALLLQAWHGFAYWRGAWGQRRAERARAERRRVLLTVLSIAVVGPALCYATWPWLWHDTVARLWAYARFHLLHVYYNMEFLGVNYWQPPMPRAYAFVMTAATVPVVTLAAAGVGLAYSFRRFLRGLPRRTGRASSASGPDVTGRSDRLAGAPLLWLLAIGVQYGAWLSPTTPIFGGTKHWMTAYPFIALFAGVGVAVALRSVRGWLRRTAATPTLELTFAAAACVGPLVQAAHAHPFGLSSYTPLVGGAAGAATLGLNRGFWGYTTGAVAGYLNRRAPPRATVYVHDTAAPAWHMLLRDGTVRSDLRSVHTVAGADFGLYHHEKHMSGQEYQNWVAFDSVRPDHIAGLDGVPVIWVYRRDADGP
ncbi:MAG: glycosyltransferase family 39 protein [Deltaproteobacteria bacterium]|jgi:hypothetical protein|nr:glycosyltransferase family 39 protein [Deltaproteobacteria bacterium]MBW2530358.1 glycosyltransferase family 39 protein [Deltaproteobacteria bacterium]